MLFVRKSPQLNIEISNKIPLSTFSKLSISSWVKAKDPSTLVKLEVDATDIIVAIKAFNKKNKCSISLTHYVAAIMSKCLNKHNDLNRVLLRNRLYQRKNVSIFFAAFVKSKKWGTDLSGVTLYKCEDKSIVEISKEVEEKVLQLRRDQDPAMKAVRRLVKPIPNIFLSLYLKFFEFILYTLNWPLTLLGLPKDPFGSVLITSLGGFGFETVYAPIIPLSRTPFLVCIGKPHLKPWVVKQEIVPRNILTITFTIDHRLLHGVQGARPYRLFKRLFNNPDEILKKLPQNH
ncbi:hypothetical protein DID80_02990 [Candidatus Marinamargulisbacteria bacterium SCGC AAA071-K20]|nr:hypothetical protein DID80_02990 [Candidatus Marinamargulisbacteria bacterium SCGC AAA071-K20]